MQTRRWESERSGVTFVEVLVAVAIISLLIALLLPAVMFARSASRRMECASRLRQIGIAFQNYHSTYNCFPKLSTPVGPLRWSVWRSILPELELSGLEAQALNVDNSVTSGAIAGSISPEQALMVPAMRCPADGNSNPGSNFAINWQGSGIAPEPDGAFMGGTRPPTSMSSFTDGTSNTAMVSEFLRGPAAVPPQQPDRSDKRRLIFNVTPGVPDFTQPTVFLDSCRSVDPVVSPLVMSNRGQLWLGDDYNHYAYNHFDLPNQNSCRSAANQAVMISSASSQHGSGVNVLFADGSTRFISDQLDLNVWRAYGTRSGGDGNSQ